MLINKLLVFGLIIGPYSALLDTSKIFLVSLLSKLYNLSYSQPFTFLFMLFLLWCYHSDYKVFSISISGSSIHQSIYKKLNQIKYKCY